MSDCEKIPNQSKERFPSIEVKNLFKSFDERPVLKGINLKVYPGEILAIIGPSGCGKTTLLKILCGLEEATSGEIIKRSERMGMVFQYSALLNSYSIGENIGFALHDSDLDEEAKEKLIREKLDAVGLEQYYDNMPDELSGGQQKRASFARAVINDPDIVFYDEPTAGLDPIASTIIEDYMNKLSRCERTAGIVVTHQHSTIRRTADRIICMFQGNIVWEGRINQLDTDENPYIRQFMDGKPEGPFTGQ
jgi:phospholipid/cholesterol/gamma-HCH transport system ATP-binding protein